MEVKLAEQQHEAEVGVVEQEILEVLGFGVFVFVLKQVVYLAGL